MKRRMNRLMQMREGLRLYFRPDIYRRLLPYIRPYRLSVGVVVGILLAQNGLALLDPWPMKILIDNALSGQPLPSWVRHAFPFLSLRNRFAIVVAVVLGGILLRLGANALEI